MRLRLTNDFHGTEILVNAKIGDIISPRTERYWRSRLCAHGCRCSGYGGIRGADNPAVLVPVMRGELQGDFRLVKSWDEAA